MEFEKIAKLRDDPEGRTKALRDALDKATKAASDAYADFNKAKTEAEQKGVDLLTDDAAFRPIHALHKAHSGAAEKAEKARAEYLAHLEGLTGSGNGHKGTKADSPQMPTNWSDEYLAPYFATYGGTKAFDVTAGGTITTPAYDELLRQLPQRALLVRSLIPSDTIDSDKFDYLRQTVFTNNAAETAAGSAKPVSVISAERIEDTVRMIAHLSEPLDRALLRDLDVVRTVIDSQMRLGVLLREDSQILNGNGTPPNLRGILNTAGILTQAKGADTNLDALYKGLMKVRNQTSPFEPSAFVINPGDWQLIRLVKDSAGQYILGPPSDDPDNQLFGKPVVVTQAIAPGVALVGDFAQARIKVREGVFVQWFEAGGLGAAGAEIASRNQVVARAEEAVGLAVERPAAFCTVTGIA